MLKDRLPYSWWLHLVQNCDGFQPKVVKAVSRYMGWEASERMHLSVAADVGGIEVIRASFYRRGVPPHIHDEYSISVVLRGGLAFDHRGSRLDAPPGAISCVNPGEVHNGFACRGEEWNFISLLVPAPLVRRTLALIDGNVGAPDVASRVIVDPEMRKRLLGLHTCLESCRESLERQSECTLFLTEFFRRHSDARCPPDREGAEREAVRRAREMLRERYAERLPLARLAERAGLSPYHFLRTFRAAIGMTPHLYLNQVRVIEAKRKLAKGMPPAEAALACGFFDQSHMARQFKRTAFVTPGRYQSACAASLIVR